VVVSVVVNVDVPVVLATAVGVAVGEVVGVAVGDDVIGGSVGEGVGLSVTKVKAASTDSNDGPVDCDVVDATIGDSRIVFTVCDASSDVMVPGRNTIVTVVIAPFGTTVIPKSGPPRSCALKYD
jgi:hypothetical protein